MTAVFLTTQALLAAGGVTAMASNRIYPSTIPLGQQLPAIAVAMTGEDDEALLQGASRYPEASVQVHCVALTATDAIKLGEAVKLALRDLLFTSGSVKASFQKDGPDFTDFADNQSTHRRVIGFSVRWR